MAVEPCTKVHVLRQLASGRWLLTISSAIALLAITATDCILAYKGLKLFVDPAAILAIITMVFMAYFNKPRDARPAEPGAPSDPTVDLLNKK